MNRLKPVYCDIDSTEDQKLVTITMKSEDAIEIEDVIACLKGFIEEMEDFMEEVDFMPDEGGLDE